MVLAGAQGLQGATEQAPLHAGLDHQRQVDEPEHLVERHRAADVVLAAVRLLEAASRQVPAGEHLGPLQGDRPLGLPVQVADRPAPLGRQLLAHRGPHVGPPAVDDAAQVGERVRSQLIDVHGGYVTHQ